MLPPYEAIYAYHKDRSPNRNKALLFFFEEYVRALIDNSGLDFSHVRTGLDGLAL